MSNNVTAVAAAPAGEAEAHFTQRLAFETDCWDVHDALSHGRFRLRRARRARP